MLISVKIMNVKIKRKISSVLNLSSYFVNKLMLSFMHVQIGTGNSLFGRIKIKNRGNIIIGDENVIFCSPSSNWLGVTSRTSIYCTKNASVRIGNKCQISNVAIYSLASVQIGDEVMIGGGTVIFDSNCHSLLFEQRMGEDNDVKKRPVVIEDGVFIGMNCIVKSARIGARSVIGAGSVVMKDIPSGECWAGNPARFIKKIY